MNKLPGLEWDRLFTDSRARSGASLRSMLAALIAARAAAWSSRRQRSPSSRSNGARVFNIGVRHLLAGARMRRQQLPSVAVTSGGHFGALGAFAEAGTHDPECFGLPQTGASVILVPSGKLNELIKAPRLLCQRLPPASGCQLLRNCLTLTHRFLHSSGIAAT
ncbi:MAG: hypothetical protein M0008_09930 [Actinomycetota bacterium]|nr:hypothetical protein [Actinomycetota bacterium]